ncbi:MAG: GH3 auxin-responsive promoter family protein [Anaerolineales bacterium]
MVKARLANALWVASCFPEWQHFTRAAENVAEAQARLLAGYLRANARAEYGEKHGFAAIATPDQYQARVPLTGYDDYVASIERIGAGAPSVLAADPVRMFELSSGSTAACKLIPYTARLKAEFQRGIAPWIFDLYSRCPQIQGGPAYWSVTPLTGGKRFTPGGLPIGFESDSAYLGPLGQWLVNSLMAVPDVVKTLASVNDFRYATLFHLLRQPELRLISVWNPTFLTLLLSPLADWWDSLCDDIQRGTLTLPDSPADFRFAPAPRLARRLKGIDPADSAALWPRLALLSCWADGPSAPYARQLAEKFPGVRIQGKGLLATEAFVSLPLVGVEGGVLAVNAHFFEFIDEAGEVRLAHQLQKGQTYAVVVTTGGGFYRYQLHDLVEVLGFWKQLPRLRFVGKTDRISDWFGEKLEECFVANALEQVFAAQRLTPIFAMLAPDETPGGFRYVLYLESQSPVDAVALDLALRANFHYDYCRKLGQLQAAEVIPVTRGAESYLRACQLRGQKLGNIKPAVLQKTTGWGGYFDNPASS